MKGTFEICTPARTLGFFFVFERNIQMQSQVSCGIPQNHCGYLLTIFCG